MQSEQINELATALAKAQAEMKPAAFDKVNPHYKNKYASLQSFITAIKEPLNKYGLSFVQSTGLHDKGTVLITKLMHSSGQWINGEMLVTQDKPGIQAFGCQLTYCKRYALSSMLGISADEDDDGELDRKETPPQKQVEPKKSAPVTKIDEKQAIEIQDILNHCEPKYQKWFYSYISGHYNVTNLTDLSSEIYPGMKESALKNMEKYSKVQTIATMEEIFAEQGAK